MLIIGGFFMLVSCWSSNSVTYTGPPPRTAPLDSTATLGADGYQLSKLPKKLAIDFQVKGDEPCSVKIELRNSGTKLVRVLIDSIYSPGSHTLRWEALDGNKMRLKEGYYYYKKYICGKPSTLKLDYRRHWY
jgi:flagellar hook assembly protein FlgD